jgi:arsenite-transporting ATPase
VKAFVFLGKGGVGKTTLSLALGCAFRRLEERVQVVSLDPAHNLRDLSSRTRCRPLPEVEEVDLDRELAIRRQRMGEQLRRRFPLQELLAGIAPEGLVRVLPGMEEEVMLDVLQRVLFSHSGKVLVLDFPPTGYALRVLRWVTWHRWWVHALHRLRKRIVEHKRILSGRSGSGGPGKDPWIRLLEERAERMDRLGERLKHLRFLVVETPDELARREARRIHRSMAEMGYRTERIVNRSSEGVPEDPVQPVCTARDWFLEHVLNTQI